MLKSTLNLQHVAVHPFFCRLKDISMRSHCMLRDVSICHTSSKMRQAAAAACHWQLQRVNATVHCKAACLT